MWSWWRVAQIKEEKEVTYYDKILILEDIMDSGEMVYTSFSALEGLHYQEYIFDLVEPQVNNDIKYEDMVI